MSLKEVIIYIFLYIVYLYIVVRLGFYKAAFIPTVSILIAIAAMLLYKLQAEPEPPTVQINEPTDREILYSLDTLSERIRRRMGQNKEE